MWHVSYYFYYDYTVNLTILSFQPQIYATWDKLYGECVHPNTVIKTKAFLCLSGTDFTNRKYVSCSILDSISVQYTVIKHINGMPSFAKLQLSEPATRQFSHIET